MVRIDCANLCPIPGGASFTICFTGGGVLLEQGTLRLLREIVARQEAAVFQPTPEMLVIQVDYDLDLAETLYRPIKQILALDGFSAGTMEFTIDTTNAPRLVLA